MCYVTCGPELGELERLLHPRLPPLCFPLFYGSIHDPKQQNKLCSTFRENLSAGAIFSPAMAAPFEDIFNKSDKQFIDICAVRESDDRVIRHVCARLSPFPLFQNESFFLEM